MEGNFTIGQMLLGVATFSGGFWAALAWAVWELVV